MNHLRPLSFPRLPSSFPRRRESRIDAGTLAVFLTLLGVALVHHPLSAAPTVGVFYYPWYASDFHGRQYLREHLVPPQLPVLGEYNDRDSETIRQHADWCRYAGIDLWIASWWGPGSREDVTLRDHILGHPDLGDIKIALLYETTGRTSNFTNYSNLQSDIEYMADHYFNQPEYFKIDGRPVLYVYLTRVLSSMGDLDDAVQSLRNAATSKGFDLYIIGDQVFGGAPSQPGDIALLDAINEYDVYGSMGASGYAGQSAVDQYNARQNQWKSMADQAGAVYIPSITPGFNDKGVRAGHDPVSRKLTETSEFGTLFQALLGAALERTDPSAGDLLFITSWNEWHEDTQIEPTSPAPPTAQDDSPDGDDCTLGLPYEGYNLRYLNLLREATLPQSVERWKDYEERER
ncbi:MAG: glycoside hydrolase family 99-like domain-containing protein [Candidatus Omnitrophica bacterium]|nr:glycoside hydrolase family 99-like domain-containing protein [Candidatus Omnitrophota bacterium]